MFHIQRPTESEIRAFADRQKRAAFSYEQVGATSVQLPSGYAIARAEYCVGRSKVDYERAVIELRQFRHYDDPQGKIRLVDPRPAFEEGATVVLLARHLGVWTLGACRVVYTFREDRRFGFAYGTLEHVLQGEERFELELGDDDRVVFRLTAFSRANSWITKCGGPMIRCFQTAAGRSYARGLELAMRS